MMELLSPAGGLDSLIAAVQTGADAVYMGFGAFNARRSAKNFTDEEFASAVAYCHLRGVRVFLTLNTLLTDRELEQAAESLRKASDMGVDAILVQDWGLLTLAREIVPDVPLHASTQMSLFTLGGANEAAALGLERVVLARELSLEQVAEIRRRIVENDIRGPRGELVEIEMFAHGALCMSISGKCYLSLYETGCSANRGSCRQLCRRRYTVADKETGAALDIDGQYVLSPKDLCTVDFLDRFLDAGVSVLKIEGRARGAEYVKRTVACYDKALRALEAGTYTPAYAAALKQELATVFNRGFWEGYYAGRPTVEHSARYGSSATRRKVYVGKVVNFYKKLSVAEVLVEAAPLAVGDEVFFTGPTTGVAEQRVEALHAGEDGHPAARAVQGELCAVRTPGLIRRGDKLYMLEMAE